jgi:hypothetical protein
MIAAPYQWYCLGAPPPAAAPELAPELLTAACPPHTVDTVVFPTADPLAKPTTVLSIFFAMCPDPERVGGQEIETEQPSGLSQISPRGMVDTGTLHQNENSNNIQFLTVVEMDRAAQPCPVKPGSQTHEAGLPVHFPAREQSVAVRHDAAAASNATANGTMVSCCRIGYCEKGRGRRDVQFVAEW